MGYLSRKEYRKFFRMTGFAMRWYYYIPVLGWWLLQRAVRRQALEDVKNSIRQRLLYGPGEFCNQPKYGVPIRIIPPMKIRYEVTHKISKDV